MLGEGLQTTREDLIVLSFFLQTLDDPVNAAAVAIAVVRRFLPAGDQAGIERLIQYRTRCPFRLSRLVTVRDTGQVVYQAEKQACRAFPDPKGDACAGRSEAEFPDPGATRFPGAASPATGHAAHSAARLAAVFEKGVGYQLPERPVGCCAQLMPDPFFKPRGHQSGALVGQT